MIVIAHQNQGGELKLAGSCLEKRLLQRYPGGLHLAVEVMVGIGNNVKGYFFLHGGKLK